MTKYYAIYDGEIWGVGTNREQAENSAYVLCNPSDVKQMECIEITKNLFDEIDECGPRLEFYELESDLLGTKLDFESGA